LLQGRARCGCSAITTRSGARRHRTGCAGDLDLADISERCAEFGERDDGLARLELTGELVGDSLLDVGKHLCPVRIGSQAPRRAIEVLGQARMRVFLEVIDVAVDP
jgi:hypothetical protein